MPTKIDETPHIYIIEAVWFNGCGIVLCYDTITKAHSSYIKCLPVGERSSEIEDARLIARYGSTFPIKAARALFGEYAFQKKID